MKNALSILRDFLPENLLAIATGFAGWLVLQFVVNRVPWPVENPNKASWAEQYAYSYGATIIIVVFLMPVIEEVLFRGLVFGNLRTKSPLVGYIVSCLLFALLHVWQFAVVSQDITYFLLMVQYLVPGLILAWVYERSGTLWASIALHAVTNALAVLVF